MHVVLVVPLHLHLLLPPLFLQQLLLPLALLLLGCGEVCAAEGAGLVLFCHLLLTA